MDRETKMLVELGRVKAAELVEKLEAISLSPEQVADEISKVASLENMEAADVSEKLAVAVFNAAASGDRDKTAALLCYFK